MLIWCPEAAPLAAGFGDGSGVPNKAKAAEPLPVQPRDLCGASILVRHHYRDGGLRVVHVERATSGDEFHQPGGAVVVADIERNGDAVATWAGAADSETGHPDNIPKASGFILSGHAFRHSDVIIKH